MISKSPSARDPRYHRSYRFLASKGYIHIPLTFSTPYRGALKVTDVIWAGENVEPIFLEWVPAVVIRFPGHFTDVDNLPADLAHTICHLRRSKKDGPSFRQIPYQTLKGWLEFLPRDKRCQEVRRKISVRLAQEAFHQLTRYADKNQISLSEAVQRAIERLCKS